MTDLQSFDLTAERNAPSKPYMTDEWKPSDERLWLKVLMVAKGRKREMTRVGPNGPRTIHAPNHGRGFRHWPNPKAVAWAVKQYNGYGGRWKGRDEEGQEVTTKASRDVLPQQTMLEQMRLGAILTTSESTPEHHSMIELERRDLVQLVEASDARQEFYWDITYEGLRHVTASLGSELTRRMESLLQGDYDVEEAKKTAVWLNDNFRFKSPKTPRGQKQLKEQMDKLWWSLAHGGLVHRSAVQLTWEEVKPKVADLVRYFSNEGVSVVSDKIELGGNTYFNRAGLDNVTLEKYARRLEALFSTVKGWRAKAFVGGLKVAFASPRDFRGTASGKYRQSEDMLYVRTTPAVLKRGEGYGGFDYILIHELGHRYDAKNPPPVNFDRPEWWTSKYSQTDSLAGSESFAELFAIGHYNMRGPWDPAILDRFEKVMS
jgi:hypothetical protein